jgi:hypothetical protein
MFYQRQQCSQGAFIVIESVPAKPHATRLCLPSSIHTQIIEAPQAEI